MKKVRIISNILFIMLSIPFFAQQISVPRIDQMSDKPDQLLIRDWKKVARDYDNLVFDVDRTGANFPLTTILSGQSINYPNINTLGMSSYVGQNNSTTSENVNILPAIVGASLVGVDKTNHLGKNWVPLVKDFFNLKNGEKVYLNTPDSWTGGDWWYEVMPNVFFYQLYSLYPDADADFYDQFVTVADRQLEVVQKLGGSVNPWQAPNMNYRAFSLLKGEPWFWDVNEPEAAGSIAWILYQAYLKTNDTKYLYGAEQALDFLSNFNTNPSYELQLPYGIQVAARLNAELDTNLDIEKMMDWAFNRQGNVRGWGCIVGKWGNYEVSGLIGEAKDEGNDYAFIMNGFQQAAALAPVAKYDKRYSKALGKWILHLANSSRLFYQGFLPDGNMDPVSLQIAKQIDPNKCIPYEAMKQTWGGSTPYAMGDAIAGGWAPTNLSLYSGSSVGYLAALIEQTNVEEILQIDLNVTDFNGENTYKRFLYYNPTSTSQSVTVDNLPAGNSDIYDVISETILQSNVSGSTSIDVPANGVCQVVIYPTGSAISTEGRILKVADGGIIDYNKGNDFTKKVRVKAISANSEKVPFGGYVDFTCLAANSSGSETYSWYVNGNVIPAATDKAYQWQAPSTEGDYLIKCIVTDGVNTAVSDEVKVKVYDNIFIMPFIKDLKIQGGPIYDISTELLVEADVNTENATLNWSVSGGTLKNENTLKPTWKLPSSPGLYTVELTMSNDAGSASKSRYILVKDLNSTETNYNPIVYYPFNGNTQNAAQDAIHAVNNGASLTQDARGLDNNAYKLTSSSQYISVPADSKLNTPYTAISLWVRLDAVTGMEQYLISHGSWENRFKMSISAEANKLRFTVKSTERTVDIEDATPLILGEYTHYTGIFTGQSVELYRNGVLVDYTKLGGKMIGTSRKLTIGRELEEDFDRYFMGAVDEVRIYDTDLSPYYISQLPTIFNNPIDKQVEIKSLTIDGEDWTNRINEKYTIDCGSTKDVVLVNIESYDGATVDRQSPISVDVSKPSLQEVKFRITSDDGTLSQDYSLFIEKRFAFEDIVEQKWNKVLTVNNNPQTNGGYSFNGYEWFRNGTKIGDKQYYSAGNGDNDILDPNAEYMVKVTTDGGLTVSTCPGKITLKNMSVSLYPNPVKLGQAIYLDADVEDEILKGAEVKVYNLSGYYVKRIPVSDRKTLLEISNTGNYILKFTSPKGLQKEFKLIVK